MKRTTALLFKFAMLSVFVAGCAEKGPILLDIPYQATAAAPTSVQKVIIGLSPLKDVRGLSASLLGKRRIPDGTDNDLVVQDTVSSLVGLRLKDALKARGFTVKDSSWDGTEGGIKPDGADILIGGEINTLFVESVSEPFKTTVKAVVQMKIVAADAAEKKIIRTLNVNSKIEDEIWPYALPKVEDALSKALSAAIDQIFADETLKGRLH